MKKNRIWAQYRETIASIAHITEQGSEAEITGCEIAGHLHNASADEVLDAVNSLRSKLSINAATVAEEKKEETPAPVVTEAPVEDAAAKMAAEVDMRLAAAE